MKIPAPALLCVTLAVLTTAADATPPRPTTSAPPSYSAFHQIPPAWSAREAVTFALENSPDSAIALEKINAAEAQLSIATSADFPLLTLSSQYSMTNNPMYSFGNILDQGEFNNSIDFNDPGYTDSLSMTASVQYRLYNGGRDRAAKDAAQAGIAGASAAETGVRRLLAFEVVRHYEAILEAEALLAVRKEARQAINSSLKAAQARWKAGDLLKQELLALETQLARAEEEVIAAQHALELARHSFLTLLGLPKQKVSLKGDIAGLTTPPVTDTSHRQELIRLSAQQEQARAALAHAIGGDRPTVDAWGNWQAEYGPELGGDGTSWSAGVKMNYTLYNGQRTKADRQLALARLRRLAAQQRKLELSLNLDLDRAVSNLDQTEKRLSVTARAVKAAAEAARLSRVQFKEGTIIASELIDYEVRLAEARTHHLSAEAERVVALANLRRAAGFAPFSEEKPKDN